MLSGWWSVRWVLNAGKIAHQLLSNVLMVRWLAVTVGGGTRQAERTLWVWAALQLAGVAA